MKRHGRSERRVGPLRGFSWSAPMHLCTSRGRTEPRLVRGRAEENAKSVRVNEGTSGRGWGQRGRDQNDGVMGVTESQ